MEHTPSGTGARGENYLNTEHCISLSGNYIVELLFVVPVTAEFGFRLGCRGSN
jgi:hypothetical protein